MHNFLCYLVVELILDQGIEPDRKASLEWEQYMFSLNLLWIAKEITYTYNEHNATFT